MRDRYIHTELTYSVELSHFIMTTVLGKNFEVTAINSAKAINGIWNLIYECVDCIYGNSQASLKRDVYKTMSHRRRIIKNGFFIVYSCGIFC